MSVMHVSPVANYEACLIIGGEHVFEITVDEMPQLREKVRSPVRIRIAFDELEAEAPRGTWSAIAKDLSTRGATFFYERIDENVFRVTCAIPRQGA
ncbi:hypothetical protein B0G57_109117 [Trinickia symbiotica]|uniref:PilZ domain-containing protein n=1 Tax=Trinickia symbiotica TaxID=863227 RepID=A0A2N7X7J2_9BURK|nr:hypothetical protein [Trinickia symbiotica]PMS37736.1 hypothetical protein C0Z20_07245 [Trinickia symbiotica]PPK44281.1 hypothetical protein B0G57_109117 [Trinickia symbiotica]